MSMEHRPGSFSGLWRTLRPELRHRSLLAAHEGFLATAESDGVGKEVARHRTGLEAWRRGTFEIAEEWLNYVRTLARSGRRHASLDALS